MDDEMDADGVGDELYNSANPHANLQPTMMDQLGHLRDRGVSVMMSDQVRNQQQQQPTNPHGMIGKLSYDNNLGKDKQIQQQRHIQQSIDQQQKQQQRVEQQVQFPALQSSIVKTKSKVLKTAKTVSNKNNKTAKKRKQNGLNTSNESLSETVENITPSSSANQFALLSELDITYASNVSYESTPPVNNCNPASNVIFNNMSDSTSRNASNRSDNQNLSQTKFCPPIILYNIDIGKLALEFKNKFPNIEPI